jgi:hypothetical protein
MEQSGPSIRTGSFVALFELKHDSTADSATARVSTGEVAAVPCSAKQVALRVRDQTYVRVRSVPTTVLSISSWLAEHNVCPAAGYMKHMSGDFFVSFLSTD